MRVTYTIDKDTVLREVRRLTNYAGHRKQGDDGAFERMRATDSDSGMLEQFWRAACDAATEQLKPYIRQVDGSSDAYEAVMEMPSLYDTSLNGSIESSLQNFFVNMIADKWFEWTDGDGKSAAIAAANALGCMQDVEKKMYQRKRPCRFTI